MMRHGNMFVITRSGTDLLKGQRIGRFKAKSMCWNGGDGKIVARQEPRPPNGSLKLGRANLLVSQNWLGKIVARREPRPPDDVGFRLGCGWR